MKKSSLKKTLLTSTMAFALAMGTAMPAFAAPLPNGDTGELLSTEINQDGSHNLAADAASTDQEYIPADGQNAVGASTNVGVYSRMGQLRVSVPTDIALALTMAGGDLAGPEARTQASTSNNDATEVGGTNTRLAASGYGIENLGGMDVKVTAVTATPEQNFELASAANKIGPGVAPTTGKIAALGISLTPSNYKGTAANNPPISLLKASGNFSGANGWTIAGATDENTPTILGITVGGGSSQVRGTIGNEAVTATKAVTISYQIGVA